MDQYDKNHSAENQGTRTRGVRYAVQQAVTMQRLKPSGHRRTSSTAHTSSRGAKDCSTSSRALPANFKYEAGPIVADGDFVMLHGRFSGFGLPVNWIAADILCIENVLIEGCCLQGRASSNVPHL
jgi:hypothetical protein